jgi:hypothetical protein
MKKHIVLLISFFIVFTACSSDKPAGQSGQQAPGQQAPSVVVGGQQQAPDGDSAAPGLSIVPAEARKNSTLFLAPKGFNVGDATVEWLVNGIGVPNPNPHMLAAASLNKGDSVQARATIKGREVKSDIVIIKNSPPVTGKVKLLPEVFKPGDLLSVELSGSDPDGDEVTFLFEWTKNGEPAGKGKTMDSHVKRGDKISLKITPFDGEDYGRSGTMNTEIANMPPTIVDNKEFKFDGKVLSHQVKATDPDGDTLTYSLKEAPQGLTIDASTGLITWTVPAGFKGKGSYSVVVKDPRGAEAFQVFNFNISP